MLGSVPIRGMLPSFLYIILAKTMISRRFYFLILAVFSAVLLVLLCFSFFNNSLIFDDEPFFRQGGPAEIISRGLSFSPRIWVYQTLAGSFLFISDKIIWLRVENLILHGCTAVVLFFLVRRLLGDLDRAPASSLRPDTTAFIVSFLFAVHPLSILAQGYLIQRTIVCATFFGLLGVLAFWQGLSGKRWALWSSCFFVFLSMYSKEHAVMLPALCFLLWLLYVRSGLPLGFRRVEVQAVLFIQVVISMSVVLWAKGVIGHAYENIAQEMLADEVLLPKGSLYPLSVMNQMGLFFKYLSILALPRWDNMGLDLRVPFPLGYYIGWLWFGLASFLIYGLVALLLLLRGGSRGLLGYSMIFPWALFATELVSVRLQEPFVLYRSYLWIPGLFIALAVLIRRVRRFYLLTLVPVFSLYLLGLSYDRLMSMSAPYFVWSEAAHYLESQGDAPGLFGGYRIYYNLGNAYLEENFVEQAMVSYNKSIALKPSYAYAYHQRGRAFLMLNETGKAKADFEQAIHLMPGYAKSYLGMADVFKSLGQPDESQRFLELGCSKGSRPACERAHPKPLLMLAPKV